MADTTRRGFFGSLAVLGVLAARPKLLIRKDPYQLRGRANPTSLTSFNEILKQYYSDRRIEALANRDHPLTKIAKVDKGVYYLEYS